MPERIPVGTIQPPEPEFVPSKDILTRYANLVVKVGANVQPEQIVGITTDFGKDPLTLAVVMAAYEAEAVYVDLYLDSTQARALRARHTVNPDHLDFEINWPDLRYKELGEDEAARITLTGSIASGLNDGTDPSRVSRVKVPGMKENNYAMRAGLHNWTAAPYPTQAWAKQVYPGLSSAKALQKLWEDVCYALRLDEPDPVSAYSKHFDKLDRIAGKLNAHRFEALHFQAPGPDSTDLRVGLLPSSNWKTARSETNTERKITHHVNLPSEEIWTVPHPNMVTGRVVTSRAFEIPSSGIMVSGLTMVFENGKARIIHADQGAESIRQHINTDDGANRLGEIALVGPGSRVAELNTHFGHTIMDENATHHAALGFALPGTCREQDADRANDSGIHTDFMFGVPGMRVNGITSDGLEIPVLIDGQWAIE